MRLSSTDQVPYPASHGGLPGQDIRYTKAETPKGQAKTAASLWFGPAMDKVVAQISNSAVSASNPRGPELPGLVLNPFQRTFQPMRMMLA
jgi:hypothetical protein